MRALVQAGDDGQKAFGEAYFAGGLCYGGQMLLHAGQTLGWVRNDPPFGLLIGLGPTVLFLILFTWIAWRNRRAKPSGMVARATGMVFGAVGLSNLALVAIIGSVAWREKNLTIWLLYPCAVFILQGAAWLVVFMLRRRAWLGFVSLGWFASGIGMALSIKSMPWFITFAAAGLLACMMAPGWAMMRLARKAR